MKVLTSVSKIGFEFTPSASPILMRDLLSNSRHPSRGQNSLKIDCHWDESFYNNFSITGLSRLIQICHCERNAVERSNPLIG